MRLFNGEYIEANNFGQNRSVNGCVISYILDFQIILWWCLCLKNNSGINHWIQFHVMLITTKNNSCKQGLKQLITIWSIIESLQGNLRENSGKFQKHHHNAGKSSSANLTMGSFFGTMSVATDSLSFWSSSFVRPAKLELEGDLGLFGDLDKLEELGDLGKEFLGDLDDFPLPRGLACPGIGLVGVTAFWDIFSQQKSKGYDFSDWAPSTPLSISWFLS